jgi:hypothetical protein
VRETAAVFLEVQRVPRFPAERDLAHHEVEDHVGVQVQRGVLIQVRLDQDALAAAPPVLLIGPQPGPQVGQGGFRRPRCSIEGKG